MIDLPHSTDVALDRIEKINQCLKNKDAIIGNSLEYLKTHSDKEIYQNHLKTIGIPNGRANVYIAHARLTRAAQASNRPVPTEASISQFIKGTIEEKLDFYEQALAYFDKDRLSQRDLLEYARKLKYNRLNRLHALDSGTEFSSSI